MLSLIHIWMSAAFVQIQFRHAMLCKLLPGPGKDLRAALILPQDHVVQEVPILVYWCPGSPLIRETYRDDLGSVHILLFNCLCNRFVCQFNNIIRVLFYPAWLGIYCSCLLYTSRDPRRNRIIRRDFSKADPKGGSEDQCVYGPQAWIHRWMPGIYGSESEEVGSD